MRVLVTGATGYIGKHVVKALSTLGCEVVALDHKCNEANMIAGVQYIERSIFELTTDFFKEIGKIDSCIHLAWKDGFVHNSEAHIEQIYPHFLFLKKVIEEGISQLAVMGTMHEVGYWEGAISENTPCAPSSFYGIAKNSLRELITTYVKGKDVTLQWIRAFYIVGDDRYSQSIFSKILRADDDGTELFPFTTGKNLYDFIDINELAFQISKVALQQDVTGVINCCSGKPMSLKDKVNEFIVDNDLAIKLDYGKFPDREYDSPGVWGDSSKIQAILSQDKDI